MYQALKFESGIFAIMPDSLQHIIDTRKSVTVQMTDAEIEDAMNRRATKFKDIRGDVAVIPLYGFIASKPSIYSALGLESSSETFGKWVEAAMDDPSVGAVVFDVDSPGGTVFGLSSVTDKIRSFRGRKPMIAVSNNLMASAAYFIASAADEIVADVDSETGSIGTIAVHFDISKALEEAGVKATVVKSVKYKGEGNPYQPLSEDALAEYQSMVNYYSDMFHQAVAVNRGRSVADIRANFGQGRVLNSQKAKEVGMIDRIASLEQVITNLVPKTSNNNKRKAAAELELLRLRSTSHPAGV